MPTKHYLVETDKGKFMVEVDEPGEPPNLQAQGGDTINGRDPNAAPSVIDRVNSMLGPLAHPQSATDLAALAIPSAEGLVGKAGPAIEAAGRGMSAVGSNSKVQRAAEILGGGEVFGNRSLGGVAGGAAIAATPQAVNLAGKGAQAVGLFLQRDTPLIQFGGPAVNVERPAAAVMQAANEAAPVAEAAAPAASKVVNVTAVPAAAEKLNLSAAETKEYLRIIKTGRPPQVAADMIKAQRAMAERLGLPTSEAVRQRVLERNATTRWPD
jgi:hypothetical protein